MPKRLTTDEFVHRSVEIHGSTYDYSRVRYSTTHTPIEIVCKIHGPFFQEPESHLRGCGCPRCANVHPMTTSEFIDRSTKIHNGKFDYSKTIFKNVKSRVSIVCPIHGEFVQFAKTHLSGAGCLKCKYEQQRLGMDEFKKRSSELHNNRYDYTNVRYIDNHTTVQIICPIHGEFSQQPRTHLNGRGCPHCSKWVSVGELEFLSEVGVPLTPSNRQFRVGKYFVDGILNNTIYEFLGDYWHGNPAIYDSVKLNRQINKTYGSLYQNTLKKFEFLAGRGYIVKYIWEHDWKSWKMNTSVKLPIQEYHLKKSDVCV